MFLFQSEITKFEEILVDYKRYKELLFKLSPTQWQEAQRAKAMEAKVPSDRDTVEQHSREPEDSACRNGKDFILVQFAPKTGYKDKKTRGSVLNVNLLNLST